MSEPTHFPEHPCCVLHVADIHNISLPCTYTVLVCSRARGFHTEGKTSVSRRHGLGKLGGGFASARSRENTPLEKKRLDINDPKGCLKLHPSLHTVSYEIFCTQLYSGWGPNHILAEGPRPTAGPTCTNNILVISKYLFYDERLHDIGFQKTYGGVSWVRTVRGGWGCPPFHR